MKTGIFGGTFDPIHNAHLLLAETAREALGLDRVIFVPAGIPPHKRKRLITDGSLRAAMIGAAIAGIPEFDLSDFEIASPEISYTVTTLRHFHALFPEDEFTLIVGSDTLHDIPHWYRPEEICALAGIAVAQRAGDPSPEYDLLAPLVPARRLARFRKMAIPMPLMELSATEIRRRVGAGKSIRFLTPEGVILLIRENGLYLPSKEQ
ncbi:MAG: nicotinate-nucleotide adenylyltransferase [Thermoguttaceae bacterium]|jgi:nicotinate-nucleotide adenylyltransferase